MKDFRFIFLRLSCYLILGILAAFYINLSTEVVLSCGILLLLLFLASFFRASRNIFPDALFGIFSFLLIFYLGFSTAYFNTPQNEPEHFLNISKPVDENTLLRARISEELKPTVFNERYILETKSLISENNSLKISGKLLLNFKTDSTNSESLKPGIEILIPWQPIEIKASLNPFQFSYKNYMSHLKVKRQINSNSSRLRILDRKDNLKSQAWNLREELIAKLKEQDFGPEEIAIFQALILGQRREISNELYKDYAAAGAIHILAISGLHIGIFLFILNFLLKPLERKKQGKIVKTILLIILLWSFAILTGLSPSVVRAVTMFSFIAVGLQMKRKTSALNSLFLSLFVLLLLNPYYIFQVGFQLSYLAVFSILTFQPPISRLFNPKLKLIDYFWKLSSVSIAAQIGVIPLSIYYFNQFPGLFLLSNLFILPLLGIVLGLGIIIILLAYMNVLPVIMVKLFNFILRAMNGFVEWVASIETFIFENIQFSLIQTLSLYIILVGCLLLLKKINFRRICFLLLSIFLFQASTIYFQRKIPFLEVAVFHKTAETIIAVKKDENLQIYSNNIPSKNILKDYKRERHIKNTTFSAKQAIIDLAGKLTLVIDSTQHYNLSNFQPDIIILSNSPKINLDRIIDQLSPKQIIADGSNYYSFVNRWKLSASNKKIPFHYTGEKGAFVLNSRTKN